MQRLVRPPRTNCPNLKDRRRFHAADIVACYDKRWSTETSYCELKQSMLGMALTLRFQFELHWAAVVRAFGKLPSYIKHWRLRLVTILKQQRPGRSYDRAVKARPQRYNVRFLKRDLN